MTRPTRNRFTFRPTLNDVRLEERVVLSSVHSVHALAASTNANANAVASGIGNISQRQLHNAVAQQYRAAYNNLKSFINTQAATLYQNGTPTAQQLADFQASVNGAINATAFQLSSQAALLPGSSRRLVPDIQNGLLGNGRTSLASRIQSAALTSRNTGSLTTLENAISRQLNNSFNAGHSQLANFFNTTNLNRLSVDSTGQRIPLSQYLGNQVISQFSNSLGALSNSFPTIAAGLYANGATPTAAQLNGLGTQFSNALGTAAFQLGSNLSLFPNAMTTLGPQLQSSLFATGVNPATGQPYNSLINSIQGLPFSSFSPTTFNTGAQTAFNTGFGNLAGSLSNFFGLQGAGGTGGIGTGLGGIGTGTGLGSGFNLPTSNFTNVFGSQFSGSNFANGFNNGFGSGFPGFGTAPTGFNSAFGTGFNNFIGTGNTGFGFNMPNFGTGTTLGTGTGTGLNFGTGSTFGFGSGVNGGPLGGLNGGGTNVLGGTTGLNGTTGLTGSSGLGLANLGGTSSLSPGTASFLTGGSPFGNGLGGFFIGSGSTTGATGTTTGSTTPGLTNTGQSTTSTFLGF